MIFVFHFQYRLSSFCKGNILQEIGVSNRNMRRFHEFFVTYDINVTNE